MAVLLAAHIGAGSVAAQTLPVPTDIGNLGGGSAHVSAVSDGFVVGSSTIPGGDRHAFVWSAASGTKTDIGALFSGSPYSVATSVNSTGQVVGGFYGPGFSSPTAFYWSQATGIQTISAVGNFSESPLLINENGVVAGVDAAGHVFRWTLAGGLQDLGVTGAGDTYVSGINSQGDIVGNSGRGNDGYAVAFVAYGSASSLTIVTSPGLTAPPPGWGGINEGGVNIQFNAINDSGVVVGSYWDFGYIYDRYHISQGGFFAARVHNSHAFRWTSADGFTDLGNFGDSYLTPVSPATFGASANAVNNDGKIVGYSFLPTGGYAPFVHDAATGLTRLPGLYVSDNSASATGINDDGVVVGFANGLAAAVMWTNGVLTNLTPSFAPQWPYWPYIKGSTIAGNGFDNSWNEHAWTLALPSTPPPPPDADGDGVIDALDVFPTNPSETTDTDGDGIGDNSDPFPNYVGTPPTRTLTVLGGVGNAGDVAANVEYLNPATGNWQAAYLANYAPYGHPMTHPWGNVPGTTRWINYKTSGASDPGASGTNRLQYLYRVRFTVPADAVNPTMTFSLKADNFAQVAINGVAAGGLITGQADQVNVDAVFSQNVLVGENTITLNIGDEGGLNGFNFRIDLSMQSSEPLEIVRTLTPTTTTVTFGAGPFVYTGSPFTATASTNPNGTPTIVYSGDCTNAGNTCTATATYAGDPTHLGSHATTSITIDPAPTTTTVSFSAASFVYTGSAIAATASAGATIEYSGSCTNVGTCTATATTAGDANHTASSAVASAVITKAPTATTVSFGAGPFVYNGSAFTATASTSPVGTPTVGYTGDCTNAGTTCTATATYDGDQNYTGSSKSASITIARAMATVAATPYDVEYDGQPHMATFLITGVSGETGATVGTVTQNTTHTTVGTYSDVWSFAGANYVSIGATAMTNKIKDTTAPVITSLSTNAPTLWPPNHKMVAVTVSALASDLVGVASLKIINVTSSEPDNGLGDGDTAGDIQVTGDLTLNLRAERAGKGNGRTYTITVEASDAVGNKSTKTCTVFVPKSQGK